MGYPPMPEIRFFDFYSAVKDLTHAENPITQYY